MDLPLEECLACTRIFNNKMLEKVNTKDPDPFMRFNKFIPLKKETKNEIINYFLKLRKQNVISSRREALFLINKRFRLGIKYRQLQEVLSPKNLKSFVSQGSI
jgi:hypothetical protein